MAKRLHVRIEHIQPSRSREEFERRRAANDNAKHEARAKGAAPPNCKRSIVGPRAGFSLTGVSMETITAIPYDIIKEGIL